MSVYAFAENARAPAATAPHLRPFKFLSVGRTHPGCVRRLNEDAFLDRCDIGLWAVADGVGGQEAGEVASALVVDALSKVGEFGSAYGFRNAVCMALHHVNAELIDMAATRSGSTIVALLVHGGHYACVWAGDSRAYLHRNGELKRITRDHSLVQNLVESGELSAEEARAHRSAHIITRAVGAAAKLELDCVHGELRAGDRFVLCSDGLTGAVLDAEIAFHLQRPPLEGALDRMMNLALSRGAVDNVTTIVVGVERRA